MEVWLKKEYGPSFQQRRIEVLWLKGDVGHGKRGICSMGLMQSVDIIEELLAPNTLSLLTEIAIRNSWSKVSNFKSWEIKSADAKE
jgi:hypothetical protein